MTASVSIEQWANFLIANKPRSKLLVPFEKQRNLISYLFQPDPDKVKLVDLCCGRGYGKSFLLVFVATMVLERGPNEIVLFLEPDWKRVRRVFLKKWRQIVPASFYEINKGEQCITWLRTGAELYYGPRNITGSQGAADDSQLGQDVTAIFDDEAALRCSHDMYIANLPTIREPSDVRFYLTASTPRVGAYRRLVSGKGHTLFRGHSADNPYLPDGYVEGLRAHMSADTARRELDGEFISLEGRIWKTAIYEQWDSERRNTDCAWPNGNRNDVWTGFNPNEPWWLMCDIGSATGAFVAVQAMDASYRGRELFDGVVWVAIADFCPDSDASASRAFQRMKREFGSPVAVTGGADLNTSSSTDGRTVSYFAQAIFGPQTRILPCNERRYNKQIQYDSLSFLMCSANNERRFTIARDFVSLDPDSHRGVREMIIEDEYLPVDKRRPGDVLPKNKEVIVQHTRDALLMGSTMVMNSPSWAFDSNPTQ
ncbi:MAG: hypothetical protein GY847_28975 [Proteobacteria bacterium]|nr:hypothetical protein [Pseudomonadota bacterium]